MKKTKLLIYCFFLLMFFCACGNDSSAAAYAEPSPSPAAEGSAQSSEEAVIPVEEAQPFTFRLMGKEYSSDTASLDLRGITHSDAEELLSLLPDLTGLESLAFGELPFDDTVEPAAGELTWEDLAAIEQAAPNAVCSGSFTLYGKTFELTDTILDLNHIHIGDGGALVKRVVRCMPCLEQLDMDSCDVSDEDMVSIRDEFPEVEVIWRIWFGTGYTCRTDCEKILASCPGLAGNLYTSNTTGLKYCTKVKYIDVGHNLGFNDISYLAYMPDLEVAIIAMIDLTDLTPIAGCTKLEFLEIQSNELTDLSPLSGLVNLKHLNIGHNYELCDISPLYGLKNLERLWIGCMTEVPDDQVALMRDCVPDCVINTAVNDPHDGWRYGTARYDLLTAQFGYDTLDYSVSWNDPKYYASDDTADVETVDPDQEILAEYKGQTETNQILIIRCTEGSHGTAALYAKSNADDWFRLFTSDAYLGQNGCGKTTEGDGKTPTGTFTPLSAFGLIEDAVTDLDYTYLTPSVYCCSDDCEYYNRIIDLSLVDHECGGEAMYYIQPEYTLGIMLDYNADCVYPNGSAIFLHCMGYKDYTAGCVAIPQQYLEIVLRQAQPGMQILILDDSAAAAAE